MGLEQSGKTERATLWVPYRIVVKSEKGRESEEGTSGNRLVSRHHEKKAQREDWVEGISVQFSSLGPNSL